MMICLSDMQRFYPIIDTGHGYFTSGKRSPVLSDGRQLIEYEFNLRVGVALDDMLEDAGITAGWTNLNPESVGNWLKGRVDRANMLANQVTKTGLKPYFVSIHSNAGPGTWTPANGAETWYYKGSEAGEKIAGIFQRHIVTETGMKDRGTKYKQDSREAFYVLRRTNMPAILTENGFFNNRTEIEYLLSDKGVEEVATAHFCAIQEIELNGWY
jgi:N-acetylmuramoyl-L-alanine amidase